MPTNRIAAFRETSAWTAERIVMGGSSWIVLRHHGACQLQFRLTALESLAARATGSLLIRATGRTWELVGEARAALESVLCNSPPRWEA